MDFKDKLFVRLLCSLIRIVGAASGQQDQVVSEEASLPEGAGLSSLVSVADWKPGPFESLDDRLYSGDHFAHAVDFNNEKMREGISQMKIKESGGRQAGCSKILQWGRVNYGKTGGVTHGKPPWPSRPTAKAPFWQLLQTKSSKAKESSGEKLVLAYLKRLYEDSEEMKNQIKILGKFSGFIKNLKKELEKLSHKLSLKSLEKVLKRLEEDEGDILKWINNVTYNNQYQIGSVFIINRLSEEKGGIWSKNGEEFSPSASNGPSADVNPATSFLSSSEMSFIKELERNFPRIFHHRDMTAKQLSKMAKVVEFVDRYHGVVGGARTKDERPSSVGRKTDENSWGKDALDGYSNSELEQSSSVNRKLSFFR